MWIFKFIGNAEDPFSCFWLYTVIELYSTFGRHLERFICGLYIRDSGSSSDCSCSYSCMIGNFYFGTGLAIINWCFVAVNYAYVWNFIIILYQKAKKCMKFYYYTISKSQDAFQPYGAVSYFSFSILHFQVSILDEKIIAYNGNQFLSS